MALPAEVQQQIEAELEPILAGLGPAETDQMLYDALAELLELNAYGALTVILNHRHERQRTGQPTYTSQG